MFLIPGPALLGLEKLITIYHAGHYVAETLPADRKFQPIPRSAAGA